MLRSKLHGEIKKIDNKVKVTNQFIRKLRVSQKEKKRENTGCHYFFNAYKCSDDRLMVI